ncbi:MAG: DUF3592 domain-containing protein [Gloeomargarita sp. SKYG116]|nr:DUF3592 domain-containing protein [Gloeomargarita sp. SKYG116]MCS7226476.1 DUF3592 domain-containing protein [Gloeomargarita sp. SKYB31]MDW8401499.1 DUF3592 domain-containing protein [Gloeomargarita sp. SKYGB_i_bin116]
MAGQQAPGLVGGIFAGLGGLFVVMGLGFAYHTRNFIATAQTATGQVIALEYRRSRGSDGTVSHLYYPVVEFALPDGEKIRFEGQVGSSSPRFRVGESVEILYDPRRPQVARINRFWDLWLLPIVFSGIGSVFFLIGVGLLAKRLGLI